MYAVDAVTYVVLIVVLAVVRVPRLEPKGAAAGSIFGSIAEGARYVVRRPLITSLMALDLSATVLSAYRVLLPALALDVLRVGPTGYGVLASAPSAGALLATYTVFRVVKARGGRAACCSPRPSLYGMAAIALAQSPVVVAGRGGRAVARRLRRDGDHHPARRGPDRHTGRDPRAGDGLLPDVVPRRPGHRRPG